MSSSRTSATSEVSTKNGAHVAKKYSATGHCALTEMFKKETIAVCDDSSLDSMATESVQNPWIEVRNRKKRTCSRGKNNWAGHQVKTSLQGAPPFDNKNIANQDEWPPCSMTRESLRTAAVKVCKKTARPGGKNKSAWRQVDRFLQGTHPL